MGYTVFLPLRRGVIGYLQTKNVPFVTPDGNVVSYTPWLNVEYFSSQGILSYVHVVYDNYEKKQRSFSNYWAHSLLRLIHNDNKFASFGQLMF